MALELPLLARAPAKVNLCLYVGPRRGDGLHELCSLFQSVTLADDVVLERAEGGADELVCPGVSGKNLATEALARFRERFGWDAPPLRVRIEKRIPVAAGLGGGSADAAAVLRLAIAAAGIEPERGALESLAMGIGADVPSQLDPGTALVTGAGERVEPLPPPALALVLLCGSGSLETGAVYARADKLGLPERDLDRLAAHLRSAFGRAEHEPAALGLLMQNDLEPAALELEPAADHALELLERAEPLGAIVSGSGPAAFGLFDSGGEAERAAARLAPHWPGKAIAAYPITPGFADPRPA
jgi:4-diphosphocytidyl-2-C-methyl-D-erythritol kinase